MTRSRRADAAGPGLATLARVASAQGVDLEETSLLRGPDAREAYPLRKGKQRYAWASNGRDLYLSMHTPNVAVHLHLGRREGYEQVYRRFGAIPMYLEDLTHEYMRPIVESSRAWVADPVNVALIEELELRSGEWASFSPGWSSVALRAREGDEDMRRVDVVLRIIEAATDASATWLHEPRLKVSALPERFRDLVPMIRAWAIDDDAVRSDRMTRARTKTLLALWTTVRPRLNEIDEYLASPGLDETHEVLKLARLAEATAEVRFELESRGVNIG